MAKTRVAEQVAPVDTTDRLMTVNEIAEYLGTHRAWVYRAMRDGTLPYVLVGSRRRVRMSDLRAYLDLAS
jgi:excisionase family DNA binding protein